MHDVSMVIFKIIIDPLHYVSEFSNYAHHGSSLLGMILRVRFQGFIRVDSR